MALALGVSVASATTPTFQFGTDGVENNTIKNPASSIDVSGVTWDDTNGLLKPTVSGTVIETIDIVFDKTDNGGGSSISDSILTITGGGQITTSRQPVIQLTSTQGLMIGTNGSGKIKVDFSSSHYATDSGNLSRSFILDLSGVSAGNIALKGNIDLGTSSATHTYGENQFIAKFGGSGMKGNVTIKPTGEDNDGLATQFVFTGNANLDGNLILEDNWNSNPSNSFTFDNGDITGKITSQAYGKNTITYGAENKTIASTLDLMAGTFTYQFASSVSNNKIFTLDTSKTNISGGHIVFDGVSKVILKNGNTNGGTLTIAPKTTNNSTYKNGSVTFKLDSSAQASSSSPIVDGNLSITNGNLTFVLKDTKSITGSNPFTNDNATPPTKTYYVNGNISITNGGFSAFWDDSIGFYGKISSAQFSATGGLIGNTNAWFSGAQSFSTIQATTAGTSHIVFDEKATITGVTEGSGQSKKAIAIKSTRNNSTQILFKKGADITGNITQERSGYNEIVLGDTSSITGDIIAQDNVRGAGGTNTLTFKNGGSIIGNISSTENSAGDSDGNTTANIITFDGTADATIQGNILSTDGSGGTNKGNNIYFNGTGTNTIKGNITSNGGYTSSGNTYIKFSNSTKTAIIQGNISSSSGKNKIESDTTSVQITGKISQTAGINEIILAGANSSITGDIEAGGNNHGSGGNTITFNNGGSITGDISTKIVNITVVSSKGQNNNTITFGGTADATITGNLFSTDGAIGNKGNIINFNGSGTNKIIGNLVASADGGFVSNGKNTITFETSTHTALIDGSITAQNDETYWNADGGINQINTSSSLTVTGNISVIRKGANNFDLKADDIILTLQGANSKITTLTALAGATSGNTLTLDATNNANVNATIDTLTNGNKLKVNFKGIDNTKTTKLTLNTANATALKSVSVTSGTNNTLVLGGTGTTEIASKVNIQSGKGITFDLVSGSSINFDANLETASGGTTSFNLGGANTITGTLTNSGIHNYNVSATSATLKYGGGGLAFASGENNINFNTDNAILNWQNTSSVSQDIATSGTATTNINFNSTNGTLATGINTTAGTTTINIANGKSGTIQGNIAGSGNSIVFASGNGASALTLSKASATHTTSTILLDDASTNNTLDISKATSFTFDSTEVGKTKKQDLTFVLGNTELSATTALNTQANGTTTIRVENATTGAKISGGNINVTNFDISGANSKVTFTASSTTIDTLTTQADGSNEIVIGEASATTSLTIGTTNSTLDSVSLEGTSATLTINGGTQNIAKLDATATTSSVTFKNSNLTIGTITNGNNLDLTLTNSALTLNGAKGTNYEMKSLSGNGSIDFVGTTTRASSRASTPNKTLTTTTLNGDFSATIFVSKDKADQITVTDISSKGTITLLAQGDINDILSITQTDGVVVAKVGSNSNVKVQGGESVVGGIVLDLVVNPDESNVGDYIIGKSITKGVDRSIQTEVNTALAINYDLFLANFNSLNKRMGELRDNPHSQGVWARVFGGAMSSEFGAGSKTEYVTAQAGYDYSLTLGNANNYMGIAIAYGKSWTKANEGIGLTTSSLSDINSNMVEVGLYNSYVMDSGWYNDTIFKFDYIMSDFTLNAGGNVSDNNTNNFAMVLSDEFGYRYKFAENEKGNWYIDPQVEVAFGYFNQSDLNHTLKSNIVMTATQDAILNLRTRAGLSLGKKFNTAKGFASLYVGAFYEYDYIEGGNSGVTLSGGISGNQLNNLESNGRAIVNVGSNIELTEDVRMYIDVEKSFGDKQRTDMQFNFGARYSFGEKTPTISYQEQQKKRVAPLKVEDKQEVSTQESKTEASANTQEQKTQANTEAKQ